MTTAPLRNTVYLANPFNDWEVRQDIYWGRAHSAADPQIGGLTLEELRRQIINHHFQSTEPYIYRLGSIQVEPQPRSYFQILKATLAEATLEEWLNTAKMIAFVVVSGCLTVAATYYGVNFLFKRHDQMTRGLLSVYRVSDPDHHRLYSKGDFLDECFKMSCTLLMIPTAAVIYGLVNKPTDSIFSAYAREKQPYRVVQKLQRLPSSMNGIDLATLANKKGESGEQEWEDPITTNSIPLARIRSPRILYYLKNAFDVTSVLKTIFAHPLQDNRIHHFYFGGYMDPAVQQTFVRDISALFCISKEKFLDCWNIDLTIEEVPDGIILANLETLARTMKFLQLIPPQAITQHLASLLLNEQKTLIERLSLDPLSLTYCEVLGHSAFSFHRFLNLNQEI
jgi:hypothetical protein